LTKNKALLRVPDFVLEMIMCPGRIDSSEQEKRFKRKLGRPPQIGSAFGVENSWNQEEVLKLGGEIKGG